jgi:hypothetical protein
LAWNAAKNPEENNCGGKGERGRGNGQGEKGKERNGQKGKAF